MTNPKTVAHLRLGVNIDHVATLRNARGGKHPDPVDAARLAINSGADGITAHLREDRRHMNDDDMARLQTLCLATNIPLNFEMAATDEMLEIALMTKPHAVCLVPEKREERTTEGGLDVAGGHNRIAPIVRALAENGSRVSLFIEANAEQVIAAHNIGAQVVEFHTGAYAHALDEGDEAYAGKLLKDLETCGRQADKLGLEVHYGHGLTFANVGPIGAIPQAKELNIGHFIIGEAIFMGLEKALQKMRLHMNAMRGDVS